MSRLAIEFVALVRKWAACSEGESTPISDGNRLKKSSPDEEA